ncbi:hypothetical protein LCGC14_2502950 [marine sediment metagenome]|uniref:Uncharacterized protein n=1 Tax=marine sediment metagenome TaxID=412755 RepID=A0A0F9B267_9ZZZZ
MFLNNFFYKLADYADRHHGKETGDEFRTYIVKSKEHPDPDLEMACSIDQDIDTLEQAGITIDEIQKLGLNELHDKANEVIENQHFRWGEPAK